MLRSLSRKNLLSFKKRQPPSSSSSDTGSEDERAEREASSTASTSGRHNLDLAVSTNRSVELRGTALQGRLQCSVAGHQAHETYGDLHILEVGRQHLFAAVISSRATARGGPFMQQNFHREFCRQLSVVDGDVAAALGRTIEPMATMFHKRNPYYEELLADLAFSVAVVDFQGGRVHVLTNGGAQALLAAADGLVVAEGSWESKGTTPVVASWPLDASVRGLIIGSPGFWQDVPADKAALRLAHYMRGAPQANGRSAAAHLTNYALHRVTERMARLPDPRMRSLKSVSHLESLHKGSKAAARHKSRQPVRRKRGDVHGDLMALVLRFDWPGIKQPRVRRHSHWNLVRLHFLHYAVASRRQTQQRWYEVVDALLDQRGQLRSAAPEQAPVQDNVVPDPGLKEDAPHLSGSGSIKSGKVFVPSAHVIHSRCNILRAVEA